MISEKIFKEYPLLKVFQAKDYNVVYDAKSNFVFSVSDFELDYLSDILESENENLPDLQQKYNQNPEFNNFFEKISSLKRKGVLRKGPLSNIGFRNKSEIRNYVKYYDENIVTRKFNIEVTEDCNFRCKYCQNTMAETGRKHSKKYIEQNTAELAIDYYFNRMSDQLKKLSPEKRKKILTINPPGISWYGGEPLLNFELIKNTHKYFLSLPWEEVDADKSTFIFGLTSNVGKLTDEILDYFVINNIMLYVSIDGPKEEHNRNRVFINGKGTFDTVYNKLKKIKKKYPEYYKTKVFIISVITDNIDREKCEEFFLQTKSPNSDLYGYKSRSFSDYSERGKIIPDAKSKLEILLKNRVDNSKYFYDKVNNTSVKEMGNLESDDEFIYNTFQGLIKFLKLKFDKPHGCNSVHSINTCPMGFDNLMVDVYGNYQMCHKTDNSLPLGNVRDGLDFEKITESYYEFNKTLLNDNCRNCWAVRLCKACAATKLISGKFIRATNDECEFIKKSNEILFEKFIELQKNDELIKYFEERERDNADTGIIDLNDFLDS